MKPAPFAYARARSLDHAIELLAGTEDTRLLAGGQSLIATLNMRLCRAALLVDINRVAGLDRIASRTVRSRSARWCATPGRALGRDRDACAADRARRCRTSRIRRSATAAPSAARSPSPIRPPNCRPACVALDGEVEIAGPTGKRAVKADDFFKGLFETALDAARRADRDPRSGGDAARRARLRRTCAPAWRLRDGRACRRARAPTARRSAMCGSSSSASARRRCARATPKPRSRAATLMPRARARYRSRSAGRRAGDAAP